MMLYILTKQNWHRFSHFGGPVDSIYRLGQKLDQFR